MVFPFPTEAKGEGKKAKGSNGRWDTESALLAEAASVEWLRTPLLSLPFHLCPFALFVRVRARKRVRGLNPDP